MTKNNSEKKAVRARMTQTGEPYSVAKRKIGAPSTLLSPWASVDALTGGFRPGNVYVVESKPGEGKATFGINLLVHFAKNKNFCFYVNMESFRKEIIQHVVSEITEIPFDSLRGASGEAHDKLVKEAKSKLTGSLVVYESRNRLTVEDISRELRENKNVKVAVLDGMNLMFSGETFGNKETIVKAFKELALELNIPIIVLGSLGRDSESGNHSRVAGGADVNLVLAADGFVELNVAKVDAEGSMISETNLGWRHSIGQFNELA